LQIEYPSGNFLFRPLPTCFNAAYITAYYHTRLLHAFDTFFQSYCKVLRYY